MSEVVAAREAYERVQPDARRLIAHVRLNLGRAIRDARDKGVSQDAIAKELGLTREQVRRFQREYEDALAAGSISSAELSFALRIAQALAGTHDEVARTLKVIEND